ncbi:MAG: hypothetical protein RLY31_2011 [Bacteroidota bacterium]|jgi:membrane-bound lytic murein transglycosylase A
MNKLKSFTVLGIFCLSSILLHNFTVYQVTGVQIPDSSLVGPDEREMQLNGKWKDAEMLPSLFTPSMLPAGAMPKRTEELSIALRHQLDALDNRGARLLRSADIPSAGLDDLRKVITILLDTMSLEGRNLNNELEAWQVWGEDRLGNVYFTGYYTPTLKVRRTKDEQYRYPIYAYPSEWQGPLPSREAIDGRRVLSGIGLEIAYASDPFDIYVMQLQGSGTVEFVDTQERRLFRYAGQNGHPYRNIQKFFRNRKDLNLRNLSMDGIRRFAKERPDLRDSILFHNPSYTFFTINAGLVKGAAEVPLIDGVSVAADPRHFPMGSVLLAEVPLTDRNGRLLRHEYRILLPQDVGGSIKGAGHIDLYCGKGDYGRKKASTLHHYGRLWLLLPKGGNELAMVP